MNLPNRINEVLEYIEENLENTIDYSELSKIACLSEYHFSRVFVALTDISISEYIRRRRLTISAFELTNSDIRIIDLAVKYCYDSADSFSRAFQKFHGVRPSQARVNGTNMKTFPKLAIQIQVTGRVAMDYRIEDLEFEFNIVGSKNQIHTSEAFEIVPKLWDEAERNGLLKQLIDMSWEEPQCKLESLLGVSGDTSTIEDEFDYMMGVRYNNIIPDGLEEMHIPKSTWAVFANTDNDIWKRIYSEWLPTSSYDLADIPVIECFYPPGHSPEKEIWLPVVNKRK